ncbi:unnamed protein product, partial [Durusdinium trenchii]
QVEYDLFQEWWFYVLMFFIIYAFAVAVHLFFDYRQWESDRVKLLMEEAATASSRPDAKRQSVKSETAKHISMPFSSLCLACLCGVPLLESLIRTTQQ